MRKNFRSITGNEEFNKKEITIGGTYVDNTAEEIIL
jgi:hypothetical protein